MEQNIAFKVFSHDWVHLVRGAELRVQGFLPRQGPTALVEQNTVVKVF